MLGQRPLVSGKQNRARLERLPKTLLSQLPFDKYDSALLCYLKDSGESWVRGPS